MMKFLTFLLLVIFIFFFTSSVKSYEPEFTSCGIGAQVGKPTGFSFKFFFNQNFAFDTSLGNDIFKNKWESKASFSYYIWELLPIKEKIPLYLGLGIF